jgi:ferrous iron transport protein B
VVIRQEAKRKLMWFSILWSTMVAYITATLFYQIATFNRHPKQTILWALGIAMFLLIASRFIRPKSDISEVVHAPAAS